jgi:hypothetical protein
MVSVNQDCEDTLFKGTTMSKFWKGEGDEPISLDQIIFHPLTLAQASLEDRDRTEFHGGVVDGSRGVLI